jgi:CheY-specific phosphatase CheX
VEHAAREVLTTTAGLAVGAARAEVPEEAFDGFVATLSLAGARGGTLVVYCHAAMATAITAGMLGLDGSDCDEETIRDALGELVNQVAGTLKRRLGAGADMVLTVPVVVAGMPLHHYVKAPTLPVAVSLAVGGDRVFVCLWPAT